MQFFWFTFLTIALLAGNLSGEETIPELMKCVEYTSKEPSEDCFKLKDDLLKCLEKSIYVSTNPYDQLFVKNINIKNLINASDYLCSKLVDHQNYTCFSELNACILPYILQDPSLNCIDDIIRCSYQKMRSCNPKDAIIFSKALTMIKSPSCTVSSYRYNLRPFYGPEIHCYPQILQLPETAAVKLGPIYENFCAAFKKEKVSQCIETVLHNGRANNYDDDYTKEAFEFFRRRSDLCEYLSNSTHKECPDVDVVSCQKDLFGKVAHQKPFHVLLKSYSNCVYDKYKTCDTALAKIIKYNLDGIKSNLDGTKSNAAHPSISFALILSQIGIIFSLFF